MMQFALPGSGRNGTMGRRKTPTVTINGKKYYRIKERIGEKINSHGETVPNEVSFYGETVQEAEEKKAKYIEEHPEFISGPSAQSKLGAVVDRFIINVFIPDGSLKASTKDRYISAYRNTLQDHPISGQKVKEITTLDLQAAYNSLTCGASTVRACHKLMTRLYSYLEKTEGIRDITRAVTLPAVEKKNDSGKIETWTPDELRRILEGSEGHRLHFLFVLLANTGMRIGEAIALRYSDIDGDILTVGRQVYADPVFGTRGEIESHVSIVRDQKTNSALRSIPLSQSVLSELEKHKQWQREEMMEKGYRTDFLFTTSSGSVYETHSLRTAFKRFLRRIGVDPRGFHVFRHTFASTLAQQETPIQVVSKLLGHADITTTAKYYVNVDDPEKRKAIDKLEIL